MRLAAIDIGSNSIKLVVVEAEASDSFAVLARDKDAVRLGHRTLRDGQLSPYAIQKAAECVKRFRSIAEARGAERILATATASVREARNATEFISRIEEETGIRVEVLSGVEEARLIGIAAFQGCSTTGAPLVNIDIGGGSTEISVVSEGAAALLFSVKLGAVGLTERFVFSDPPKAKELRALREEIRAAMERPGREMQGARWQQASGTSGTILALGEALKLYRSNGIDPRMLAAQPVGTEIRFEELERFNVRIGGMNLSERRALPAISSQRADILVAGGQILEGVMSALTIKALRTCDWALREGVIINALRDIESESGPPVVDITDYKLRSVHAVGRRFGYEEAHASRVSTFAEKIFDTLASSAGLKRRHRTLLSAASLLHDVGYHIAHDSHHKHSLYLIKNSELTGFSEGERLVIANIARYHRGSPPRDKHPDFGILNDMDRASVHRLSAILRIADALDRSHDGRVKDILCVRDGQIFNLQLRAERDCEQEIWAAERKSDMLEEAFNCKLAVSQRALSHRSLR